MKEAIELPLNSISENKKNQIDLVDKTIREYTFKKSLLFCFIHSNKLYCCWINFIKSSTSVMEVNSNSALMLFDAFVDAFRQMCFVSFKSSYLTLGYTFNFFFLPVISTKFWNTLVYFIAMWYLLNFSLKP